MQNLQQVFEQLVLNPEHPKASEWLKAVALAFWYEDFVPTTDSFSGDDVAQAGFVLDKLSRYSCTPLSSKQKVRDYVLPTLKLNNQSKSVNTSDALAMAWGVNSDLKYSFKSLLPYQRRSYQHLA
ncbi:hypothetical protein [uncultured Paraglaciecola sp.]|uniref:hypothetical protein n=1 Tax=uncultured Paraglaciecola sp. TaxID=1765024 RepID=UPI0025939617|nr:hypothetical protein [uncultured Paraglaciecola sp.]